MQFQVNFNFGGRILGNCLPFVSNKKFGTIWKGGLCIYLDTLGATDVPDPMETAGRLAGVCEAVRGFTSFNSGALFPISPRTFSSCS